MVIISFRVEYKHSTFLIFSTYDSYWEPEIPEGAKFSRKLVTHLVFIVGFSIKQENRQLGFNR